MRCSLCKATYTTPVAHNTHAYPDTTKPNGTFCWANTVGSEAWIGAHMFSSVMGREEYGPQPCILAAPPPVVKDPDYYRISLFNGIYGNELANNWFPMLPSYAEPLMLIDLCLLPTVSDRKMCSYTQSQAKLLNRPSLLTDFNGFIRFSTAA